MTAVTEKREAAEAAWGSILYALVLRPPTQRTALLDLILAYGDARAAEARAQERA